MPKKSAPPPQDPAKLLFALLPALAALAVFSRSLGADFLNWDDFTVLGLNRAISPFSAEHLRRVFTTANLGTYAPLATLSSALDQLVWGLRPGGHHLTSLLLHCANAALFAAVCRRLIAAAAGSAETGGRALAAAACFGALVFCLHPLRVESVTWLSDRHDLLCVFFLLGSVLAYLAARRPGAAPAGPSRGLLLPLGLFLAALFSKGTAVTLPPLLLLLDVYPLRRLPADPRVWAAREHRPALLEKLPFFALSLFFGLLALRWKSSEGAMLGYGDFGPAMRLAETALGAAFYPLKTVLPFGLSPFYRAPDGFGPLHPAALLSGAAVLGLTWGAWRWRRALPSAAAAWAGYLLLAWPLLGVFKAAPCSSADRYSYLACLPFAALAGGGAYALLRSAGRALGARLAWLSAVPVLLGLLAWNYQGVWSESESLWRYAIKRDPGLAVGYLNLGSALVKSGQREEAEELFRRALMLAPALQYANNNLASLRAARSPAEAAALYGKELERYPNFAPARVNKGVRLAEQGRFAEAVEEYRQALKLRPDMDNAHDSMGVALAALGRLSEAEAEHRQALRIRPGSESAHYNLGYCLSRQGRLAEAEASYRRALDLRPDMAAAHNNLGTLLAATGRGAEAQRHYRDALRLDPGYAEACYNLGTALHKAGRLEEAAGQYARAVELNPAYAEAHYNLAMALHALGREGPALEHLKRAVQLNPALDPRRRSGAARG